MIPTRSAMPARWSLGQPSSSRHGSDREIVDHAIRGDRSAAAALAERLMPVLHKRVRWVLSRRPGYRVDDVVDHAQETLLHLFEDDFRLLRTWDPRRGASLATFVGLCAERAVLSALRSGRRSGWREAPTENRDLERSIEVEPMEGRLESREALRHLSVYLETELTPRSQGLFEALYVEDLPPDEAAARFGMSLNALYSWRSRFRSQAARWLSAGPSRAPAAA